MTDKARFFINVYSEPLTSFFYYYYLKQLWEKPLTYDMLPSSIYSSTVQCLLLGADPYCACTVLSRTVEANYWPIIGPDVVSWEDCQVGRQSKIQYEFHRIEENCAASSRAVEQSLGESRTPLCELYCTVCCTCSTSLRPSSIVQQLTSCKQRIAKSI